MPSARRISASERLTSARSPIRLRCRTAPVLPPTPTFPVFSISNARIAGVDQVPQLVGEEPQTLAPARRLTVPRRLVASAAVLGDGPRDRIVEAPVQRAEIFRADRRVGLHRQFGDRLADVAVVVHHLRDREALAQQVLTVLDRAAADLAAFPIRPRRSASPTARGTTARRGRFLRLLAEGSIGVATLARQRLIISSRLIAMNSCSMSGSGVGAHSHDSAMGTVPF